MAKKKRKKKQPVQQPKARKVKVVGPPLYELTERIRIVLEEELWYKKQRAIENPKPETLWLAERVQNALDALNELERRAAK